MAIHRSSIFSSDINGLRYFAVAVVRCGPLNAAPTIGTGLGLAVHPLHHQLPLWRVMSGRVSNELVVEQIAAIARPGKHSDGKGLDLRVTSNGTRSWIVILIAGGRWREWGLAFQPGGSRFGVHDPDGGADQRDDRHDLAGGRSGRSTWTIPGERMKAEAEHTGRVRRTAQQRSRAAQYRRFVLALTLPIRLRRAGPLPAPGGRGKGGRRAAPDG